MGQVTKSIPSVSQTTTHVRYLRDFSCSSAQTTRIKMLLSKRPARLDGKLLREKRCSIRSVDSACRSLTVEKRTQVKPRQNKSNNETSVLLKKIDANY